MKISVIFGIIHMTIGIMIKATNTIYKKDFSSFMCEVVTGLIILLGLFGYMDLLIFLKWFIKFDIDDPTKHEGTDIREGEWISQRVPTVINFMIDLVFNFGKPKSVQPDSIPFFGSKIMDEFNVGVGLLITIVICVPVMLCVKPIWFRGGPTHGDIQVHEGDDFSNIRNAG